MSRQGEFDGAHMGPAEARKRYNRRDDERYQYGRSLVGNEQRMFPVSRSDYMLEPHQQTRTQFADDPRTWWHGRYSEQLPTRAGAGRNAGIHVGTEGSARHRQDALGAPQGGKTYRFFPVRLKGAVDDPTWAGHDEGARWEPKSGIHLYHNRVEDRGSVSALVPSRTGLQTHGDAIKEAKAAGKKVDPTIEWESKQLGRRQYDPTKRDKYGGEVADWKRSWTNPNIQERLFNPDYEGNRSHDATRRYNDLRNEALA